ncbi:hypothetical protein MKX01_032388 [Papaver californicum]|nr:hypothetical protein MKX01_032388 [Papaver californicum]
MFNCNSLVAPQVQRIGAYKTVVASNLSHPMDKSKLIDFFEQAGEVVDARLKFETCKSTWLIQFATEEAAKKVDFAALTITGALKTLVAKNLSFSTTESDVVEFFKQAGEIVDVHFSLDYNGDFGGNCHIEFATAEAAIKAVKLNGKYLFGRPVVLGFTRETICIQGFDTSLGFEQVQSSLMEFFSTCGEISWIHIPTFPYTGIPKGIALMEFFDFRAFPKARAMNGHKLGQLKMLHQIDLVLIQWVVFVEYMLAQFSLSGATHLTEIGVVLA